MQREQDSFSRRQVMHAMGSVAFLAATGAAAGAQPAPPPPAGAFGAVATDIHTELKTLAPNVYAFLQREAAGQSNLSVSNFGIVAGLRSLLAIDAGGGPQHARNFIAAARPLGKPFDRVVITHEHPDHIVGLTQFPAGIEIIAQEETRLQMVKMGQPATPAYWATNPAWGRADDVNRVILPTVTFRDRMSVFYGDIQVDFVWPGRAHTSGDALVRLPKERILFMGDIGFFGVTPLNGSGFIADWIKVCDALLQDAGVDTIVPGHGPVGTKSDLKEMRDYLALLMREGRRSYDAGVSPGRAAAQLDLGKYSTWTDSDRVANNMARLYTELQGTIGTNMDRGLTQQAVTEYNQLKRRP
ncbi:MAG: MBL fold metallo-hydrolase [Pseudomonadota bacterium]